MDEQLVRVVAEDLEFLRNEWHQEIDDVSLRRSSNILRSLLVHSNLQKVASYMGEVIYVNAPEIVNYRRILNDPTLRFYQCGGASYRGLTVGCFANYSRAFTDEELREMSKPSPKEPGGYEVRLGRFLRHPSFVVSGLRIDRLAVISYVANKLGGAHYDSNRSSEKDRKYVALDAIRESVRLADKNAIYYELLSIGQRIVKSQSVDRLYEIIARTIMVGNDDKTGESPFIGSDGKDSTPKSNTRG